MSYTPGHGSHSYDGFSDFDDDPYSSPAEFSENDDNVDELDFSEFTGVDDVEHSDIESSDYENNVNYTAGDVSLWCTCGHCVNTKTDAEAICCHDRPEIMDLIPENDTNRCVTEREFFQNQLLSEEGLHYNRFVMASMIKSQSKRQEYLRKKLVLPKFSSLY